MYHPTIKEYIDDGFTLTFCVSDMHKFEGMLNGRYGRVYLTQSNMKDFKKYKNIFNLLNNSFRIIKISGEDNHYILQMLDLQFEGPYNENQYYLLEDLETDSDLLRLLENYDNKVKEETNVKTK